MKKDLQSYKKHDSQYVLEKDSYTLNLEILEKYKKAGMFKNLGFEYAIRMSNPLPDTHIDVGSGNGWLANLTQPFFKNVIGIEPSEAIVSIARKINKDHPHVSFVNKDMIEGLESINPQEPVFITSGTVLNHIENYYVENFLKRVNTLPKESTLFFEERYDTNIDWNMWHVRSKDWWIKNLPNWQLFFFNIENNNYSSGVYGICVGKDNVVPMHTMTAFEKASWGLGFYTNVLKRVLKKIKRILHL